MRGTKPIFILGSLILCVVLGGILAGGAAGAATKSKAFCNAKTVFQTNLGYDPRIALAVDGVIVHQHGAGRERVRQMGLSWSRKGYALGRMFFADSDAVNSYWKGKWDGQAHADEVERNAEGEVVKCANIRPYMLPTEGWIRYLEEMARISLEEGYEAILPEEPLAHIFTGYEKAFRALWKERYGMAWEPEKASALARYRTGQLKNELYIKLEKRLLNLTRRRGREQDREIGFVVPVHAMYSNIAAQLVAPLGTAQEIGAVDGYIGQIWTGPVNWALGNYQAPGKSFFCSAYALYDFFAQLTAGNDKKLWLLIDPVEDNPHHAWSAFSQWYQHCATAMLLMYDVNRYEIMPWPDRIFLPGYQTGGGTPAPEDYRITILAVTQVLQEIARGGRWQASTAEGKGAEVSEGIGVAVADTLMWEEEPAPRLQVMYSLLLPLIGKGVPVSSFMMERCGEPGYLGRFKVIVVCHESWKPTAAEWHEALAQWVKIGGVLIVLGKGEDELDRSEAMWWRQRGYSSARSHLLALLEGTKNADEWSLGKGWVLRREVSPREFADPTKAEEVYFPLLDRALKKLGEGEGLKTNGHFCLRRGVYLIGHAEDGALSVPGRYVDIFDPALAVREGVRLAAGESGVYKDVEAMVRAYSKRPGVLHATHRLMGQAYEEGTLRFTVRGPSETPGVARLFWANVKGPEVSASNAEGQSVPVTVTKDRDTLLLRFANDPEGITIELK